MSEHKISDAARATGFSVSALRFYEKESVVVPERTQTGYRVYSEDELDALRFVRRGKQLGLSLDDIKELLDLFDDEDCAPVQARIRELVGDRITQAQSQIADLVEFTAQLQDVMARLNGHTADGACDDQCGCVSEPMSGRAASGERELIPLAGSGSDDIACSLDPDLVEGRVEDWRRLLSRSGDRTYIPGGVRVHFDRSVDVGDIAELAAAEQRCCSFFRFSIDVSAEGVALAVTGPEDAQDVITSVFGKAA